MICGKVRSQCVWKWGCRLMRLGNLRHDNIIVSQLILPLGHEINFKRQREHLFNYGGIGDFNLLTGTGWGVWLGFWLGARVNC